MSEAERREQWDKLEQQIIKLREELANWQEIGVPRHTMVVLLQHYTKVPQRTIRSVLEGLDVLYEEYFEEDDDD